MTGSEEGREGGGGRGGTARAVTGDGVYSTNLRRWTAMDMQASTLEREEYMREKLKIIWITSSNEFGKCRDFRVRQAWLSGPFDLGQHHPSQRSIIKKKGY